MDSRNTVNTSQHPGDGHLRLSFRFDRIDDLRALGGTEKAIESRSRLRSNTCKHYERIASDRMSKLQFAAIFLPFDGNLSIVVSEEICIHTMNVCYKMSVLH